jgi:hypothetical protein
MHLDFLMAQNNAGALSESEWSDLQALVREAEEIPLRTRACLQSSANVLIHRTAGRLHMPREALQERRRLCFIPAFRDGTNISVGRRIGAP